MADISPSCPAKGVCEREVHIVMVPVKDIGPTRKAFVRILIQLMGHAAAAEWVMHWAIFTQDTCFELQRFPEPPYTRLKASRWVESRNAEVLHRIQIGTTQWSDKEIEDAGMKYFASKNLLPYNVYLNNCQTFVNQLAVDICSVGIPRDKMIAIPIQHVISYTAARLYTLFIVPLMCLWYRLRGVDHRKIAEFEQLSAFFGYALLPSTILEPLITFPMMCAQLQVQIGNLKDLSTLMWYLTVVFLSVNLFGYVVTTFLVKVQASQPSIKRYSDGIWRMQYRPNKLWTMNADGTMTFEDLAPEIAPEESTDLTDENGRFPGSKDPSRSLVIAIWGISGFGLTVAYWSYQLVKRIVRTISKSRVQYFYHRLRNTRKMK